MKTELELIQEAYLGMYQLNEEKRAPINKQWNEYGHKEVAVDHLSGTDDNDDDKDGGNSYSVKLEKAHTFHDAKVHDSGWEHGVPEYKSLFKHSTPTKSITLPANQHVTITPNHIYGQPPSTRFF